MAAKAWGGTAQQKPVEEVFFQNDSVSLCMMLHRRAKTMRVIDFRAGPTQAKRMFVMSMAQREGVEKVFTLVERDEVGTWLKLGFAREGNIPGFYKRSDAFMLGCSVSDAADRTQSFRADSGEMRIAALADNDDEIVEEAPLDNRAQELAERTIVTAKKRAKDLAGKTFPIARITEAKEAEVKKAVANALKAGRALTAFEPFGRDVERRYYTVTARGGYELTLSTESQACFGNAFLELLTAPKNDAERLCAVSALKAICDKMLAEDIVSCFSLAPSDDLGLATAFVHNGFRRTGLLQNHLQVGNDRKDAIIWSRKLANPAED
jgi:hypothetical protein